MPQPTKRMIPAEAGYPGAPIRDEPPELKKAFEFYNEAVRPRREFHSDLGEHGEWRKVEFGKPGGELYPVWTSTPWDLREFGLGIAMYFQTLQLLAATFFFAGLFQAQAISYYKSVTYSNRQVEVPGMLRGSAVCTQHEVVCLDEWCESWDSIGTANLCHMGVTQAGFDFTMTVLLLILLAVVTQLQDNVSASLDESLQTAQDYSVMVDDPDADAQDPDEWRDFFSQFGHVTFVTVAKDNGPLLRVLADRRAIMREIIMTIGNGEKSAEEDDDGILDTTWNGDDFQTKLAKMSQQKEAADGKEKTRQLIEWTGAFGMKPMKKWVDALAECNTRLQQELDEANYGASKIFVTFETEQAQRRCLKALTMGLIPAAFDMGKDKMQEEHIFRGTNVLAVKEAPEPNEVFWEDVDVVFKKRVQQQGITLVITVLMVVGSVFACKALQVGTGPTGSALWISLTNILIPIVLRKICFTFEDHVSANDQQMSLFLKLTFFRWCNTAIVLYFITDFDEFLTVKAIKQVQAVIMADALTTPIIRTLNPADAINQLLVCNYAYTQEKMNNYFLGTAWYPAERYADMTKTMFLALFFSCLYPAGLFLTAFGYVLIYTVDKYSLLRSWRTEAELDDDITKISRTHMIFAVYCHAVMTMVFYSEFPFDGVCPNSDESEGAPPTKLEYWRYEDAKEWFNITTDRIYHPCDQSVGGRIVAILFVGSDALERESTYGKQERVVRVYGVLVVTLTILLFLVFFGKGLLLNIYNLFYAKYMGDGTNANMTRFTQAGDIQAYIPKIGHPSLPCPLVAADVEGFDPMYLSFEQPTLEDYKIMSLWNSPELPGFSDEEKQVLFSHVKYYPPPPNFKEEEPEEEPKDKKKQKKKGDYEKVPAE